MYYYREKKHAELQALQQKPERQTQSLQRNRASSLSTSSSEPSSLSDYSHNQKTSSLYDAASPSGRVGNSYIFSGILGSRTNS